MTGELGTLGAIAERTGGRVIGDATVRVGRIAAIDDVDVTALTFATDERFLRAVPTRSASAGSVNTAAARDASAVRK